MKEFLSLLVVCMKSLTYYMAVICIEFKKEENMWFYYAKHRFELMKWIYCHENRGSMG